MKSENTWISRTDVEHKFSVSANKEDDDADFRPILQGVINTRCTYDGSKVEGTLEG